MCVNKQPTYNQGKLKLTRYIYWTSPLAKAKGNVWQQHPRIRPTPKDATYNQHTVNIQPTI